jgi:hypothetical protein
MALQTPEANRLLSQAGDTFAVNLIELKPPQTRAVDSSVTELAFSAGDKEGQLELVNSRYSLRFAGQTFSELDAEINAQAYPLRTLPYDNWYNYEGFKQFINHTPFFATRYTHFHKHSVKSDIRSELFDPLWNSSDPNIELYESYFVRGTKRLRGKSSPLSPYQAYVRVSPLMYVLFSCTCLAMYYMDVNHNRDPLHRMIMSEDWWILPERKKNAALRLMCAIDLEPTKP